MARERKMSDREVARLRALHDEGLEARFVGTTDGKLRIVTVWESKAHADRFFAETLGPALAKALGPEPVGMPANVGIAVTQSYVRQPIA